MDGPVLRVERGEPDDTELAALAVALTALHAAATTATAAPPAAPVPLRWRGPAGLATSWRRAAHPESHREERS